MTKCCHHDHSALAAEKRPAEGSERKLIVDLIQGMNHPSAKIVEIAAGSKFIGIRAEEGGKEHAGLASTLGAAPNEEERQMVEKITGKSLGEAAELLKSDSPFSISLGGRGPERRACHAFQSTRYRGFQDHGRKGRGRRGRAGGRISIR